MATVLDGVTLKSVTCQAKETGEVEWTRTSEPNKHGFESQLGHLQVWDLKHQLLHLLDGTSSLNLQRCYRSVNYSWKTLSTVPEHSLSPYCVLGQSHSTEEGTTCTGDMHVSVSLSSITCLIQKGSGESHLRLLTEMAIT